MEIWCDADVTERATIDAANTNFDKCQKVVSMKHADGCAPEYTMLGFLQFMSDNVWLSGTCLIIVGAVIGVFGGKYFVAITGGFAGLCAFIAVMILCSMFKWLESTGMMIVSILLACAAAGAAYKLLSNDWLATMFLCIGGGFLLGGVTEGLIISITGWGSFTFYLIITIIF